MPRWPSRSARLTSLREKYIGETNAYLNWAARHGHTVPRIPARPTHDPLFEALLRTEQGRAAGKRFWALMLGPWWNGPKD